ncbi:MAG: MotA/TolQ/ExbB proton channel family protein, partial [Planctomycetes bacterium]|nr:MotA/TolQ/ExbB proton channel family protein [Planctomycetota bacterium]
VETTTTQAAYETTLWGLWQVGGWAMYPIGLLCAAAVGLAIYAGINVNESKMLCPDILPTLQQNLTNLELEQARTLCNGRPSLLTNTLAAGLERISDGVIDIDSMEKAMEAASVQEVTNGLKPINYLSIIAQLAPMWGLLGTVSGMIKAFQKIGMGGMGKPELLATNIGEAMITTAFGLLVGIPAMFFYFYYKSKYMSFVSQLGRILGNLSHQLVATARRAADGGLPAPAAASQESGA